MGPEHIRAKTFRAYPSSRQSPIHHSLHIHSVIPTLGQSQGPKEQLTVWGPTVPRALLEGIGSTKQGAGGDSGYGGKAGDIGSCPRGMSEGGEVSRG